MGKTLQHKQDQLQNAAVRRASDAPRDDVRRFDMTTSRRVARGQERRASPDDRGATVRGKDAGEMPENLVEYFAILREWSSRSRADNLAANSDTEQS